MKVCCNRPDDFYLCGSSFKTSTLFTQKYSLYRFNGSFTRFTSLTEQKCQRQKYKCVVCFVIVVIQKNSCVFFKEVNCKIRQLSTVETFQVIQLLSEYRICVVNGKQLKALLINPSSLLSDSYRTNHSIWVFDIENLFL